METNEYNKYKAKKVIAACELSGIYKDWKKLEKGWIVKNRIPRLYINIANPRKSGRGGSLMVSKKGGDRLEFNYNDLVFLLSKKNELKTLSNLLEKIEYNKFDGEDFGKYGYDVKLLKSLLERMQIINKDGRFKYDETARLKRKLAIEVYIRYSHILRINNLIKIEGEPTGNRIEYTLNDLLYLFAKQKRVAKIHKCLNDIEEGNFITFKELLIRHKIWFKFSSFLINSNIVSRSGDWLLVDTSLNNHQLACRTTLAFYHYCKSKI